VDPVVVENAREKKPRGDATYVKRLSPTAFLAKPVPNCECGHDLGLGSRTLKG